MTIDNLLVQDSSVHGLGLFSAVNHKEGQVITIISGELINGDECERREEEGNVYIFYKDEDEYIDASKHSQLRYLNHSCDYNCDIDEDENGNLILFATTDIHSGDELTIDYGYEEIYDYCSCNECGNKSDLVTIDIS
ncbi:MAG: SET domain-containing protein-lysine N-methyltransferase [Ignavibacteriales bacterium]|nr:SET domain-containing protein-lysine N-methyltransferase [Ignavibacteriales bacterium]